MNSRCSIYAVAFTQHLCNCIHAAPMQPHSRHRTYTAALTPPYCFVALTQSHLCCSSYAVTFMHLLTQHLCSIHTAALMLSRSDRRIVSLSSRQIEAATLTLPHLCSSSAPKHCSKQQHSSPAVVLTLQHLCRSMHAAALTQHLCSSIHAAAHLLPRSRRRTNLPPPH